MAALHTHYDHLQVSPQATAPVIRAAFKTLAQKWHPDKHPNNFKAANIKFGSIKLAYDVLSDIKLRAQHDQEVKRFNRRATDRPTKPVTHSKLIKHYSTEQIKTSISIKV